MDRPGRRLGQPAAAPRRRSATRSPSTARARSRARRCCAASTARRPTTWSERRRDFDTHLRRLRRRRPDLRRHEGPAREDRAPLRRRLEVRRCAGPQTGGARVAAAPGAARVQHLRGRRRRQRLPRARHAARRLRALRPRAHPLGRRRDQRVRRRARRLGPARHGRGADLVRNGKPGPVQQARQGVAPRCSSASRCAAIARASSPGSTSASTRARAASAPRVAGEREPRQGQDARDLPGHDDARPAPAC